MDDERIEIYTIPPNFAEEGTILSGRIKTRNAVETALILMVLVPVIVSLEAAVKTKMYIGMIVLVPVVILAVIGVQGESLFSFIASFFRFVRRRRCLTVPDERYRLEQNRKRLRGQRGGRKRREREKVPENPKQDMEAGAEKGTERAKENQKAQKDRKNGFFRKKDKGRKGEDTGNVS